MAVYRDDINGFTIRTCSNSYCTEDRTIGEVPLIFALLTVLYAAIERTNA